MPAYFYGVFKKKNYIMVEEVFVILLTTYSFVSNFSFLLLFFFCRLFLATCACHVKYMLFGRVVLIVRWYYVSQWLNCSMVLRFTVAQLSFLLFMSHVDAFVNNAPTCSWIDLKILCFFPQNKLLLAVDIDLPELFLYILYNY